MLNPAATTWLGRIGMGQGQLPAGTVKFITTMEGDGIATLNRDTSRIADLMVNNQTHQIRTDANLETLCIGISAQFTHDRTMTTHPDPGPSLAEGLFKSKIIR